MPHEDTFTCVEHVDVDLPQGLIVLSRAVATEGIDLVAHSHGRVVHPPWPPFQVHCPPEHSSLRARRSSGPPLPQPHASEATARSATQTQGQNNNIHPSLNACCKGYLHVPSFTCLPAGNVPLGKGTQSRAQRSKQRCPCTQNPSGWLHRQPQPNTFGLGTHTSRSCQSHLSA